MVEGAEANREETAIAEAAAMLHDRDLIHILRSAATPAGRRSIDWSSRWRCWVRRLSWATVDPPAACRPDARPNHREERTSRQGSRRGARDHRGAWPGAERCGVTALAWVPWPGSGPPQRRLSWQMR